MKQSAVLSISRQRQKSTILASFCQALILTPLLETSAECSAPPRRTFGLARAPTFPTFDENQGFQQVEKQLEKTEQHSRLAPPEAFRVV